MSRPLVAVACAFAAGAATGGGLPRGAAVVLLALGATLLAAGVAAARATRSRSASAAVLGATLALGAADASLEGRAYDAAPLRRWAEAADDRQSGPVLVRGVCRADPRELDERWILLVDVDDVGGTPMAGTARIDVGGGAPRPPLIDGDAVTVWADLRIPRGLSDPDAFDGAAQARRDGVHAVGWAKSPRLVVRTGRGDISPLRDAASRARQWARGRLVSAIEPGREQAVVRAMVLGERTALDRETSETFRMAGTYHVLALSGAQVALVAALLNLALRRLRASPLLSGLAVSATLAFYCAFVGGDVPVLRATVMAIVVVLGRALDLDGDAANLLGLAALILLAHRPSSIGDIGFQLSFAATFGLVMLT